MSVPKCLFFFFQDLEGLTEVFQGGENPEKLRLRDTRHFRDFRLFPGLRSKTPLFLVGRM